MTFMEVCGQVAEKGMLLMRPHDDGPLQYEVRPWVEQCPGWVIVDSMTAGVCLQIYKAASDEIKQKLEQKSAMEVIRICWYIYRQISEQT